MIAQYSLGFKFISGFETMQIKIVVLWHYFHVDEPNSLSHSCTQMSRRFTYEVYRSNSNHTNMQRYIQHSSKGCVEYEILTENNSQS